MMPQTPPRVNSAIAKLLESDRREKDARTNDATAEFRNTLASWIDNMSDPESRSFEHEVYESIRAKIDGDGRGWSVAEPALREIIDQNKSGDHTDRNRAYKALYMFCTLARRENRLGVCEKILNRYSDLADGRASYEHLWAMVYSSLRDTQSLNQAHMKAMEARRIMAAKSLRHVGMDHNYAEIVALRAEARFETGDSLGEDEKSEIATALALAQDVVGVETDYAKFHATVGRLKLVQCCLDEAEMHVLTALTRESDNWDSPARRIEYRSILTRIQLERQKILTRKELEAQKKHFEEDLRQAVNDALEASRKLSEETKLKHVEILGVFAGVLALVLAGMAGLFEQKPDAPRQMAFYAGGTGILLMMLGGTILVVFGGLGVAVHERWKGPAAAMGIGFGLFLFAGTVAWRLSSIAPG